MHFDVSLCQDVYYTGDISILVHEYNVRLATVQYIHKINITMAKNIKDLKHRTVLYEIIAIGKLSSGKQWKN